MYVHAKRLDLIVLSEVELTFGGHADRLESTLAALPAVTLRKIRLANVHKGTLEITWIVNPDESDMSNVERLWYHTHSECCLEYFFPSGTTADVSVSCETKAERRFFAAQP